jgi:hypothetical protein
MAKPVDMDTLILEAMHRALVDPAAKKLHGTKANPGIFLASSAPAKTAAQRCLELGLLEQRGEQKTRGKAEPLYGVTPAAIAYVLKHSPEQQTLNAAREGIDRLAQTAAACQDALAQVHQQADLLRDVVQQATARLQPPDVKTLLANVQAARAASANLSPPAAAAAPNAPRPELAGELLTHLQQFKGQAPMRPMDLPQLLRFARSKQPALTVGQFHDVLRRLMAGGQIRLSPFTQAMYQLPEPECAMIVGREIMYYVERA